MACYSIKCEPRAWRIFFTCLCFLCICLIIALYSIVRYWKNQTPSKTATQIKDLQHLCLKCQDVSVHPIDDQLLLRNFETKDDNKTCCTKDNLQVKHLVHQFLEKNYRISMASEGFAFPKCVDYDKGQKPAGRVVGVDHNQTAIAGIVDEDGHLVDKDGYLLRWRNNTNGSFHTPEVTFTDGQLKISETGYYWFHSLVTFRDKILTSELFAFSHKVFRRPFEYPSKQDVKLIEAGNSRCKFLAGFTDHRSFVGDIAYFKKGDIIIVKVSNPEMVSTTPYDSFLEVHLY